MFLVLYTICSPFFTTAANKATLFSILRHCVTVTIVFACYLCT